MKMSVRACVCVRAREKERERAHLVSASCQGFAFYDAGVSVTAETAKGSLRHFAFI